VRPKKKRTKIIVLFFSFSDAPSPCACAHLTSSLFTLVMKFHDRQSSERCIRKLISCHCFEKTCMIWNDFLFLITDDCDFHPQTCTNCLVFRGCKHIKNIFEDVSSTKKTDCHDITEILLKVALNTITLTPSQYHYLLFIKLSMFGT